MGVLNYTAAKVFGDGLSKRDCCMGDGPAPPTALSDSVAGCSVLLRRGWSLDISAGQAGNTVGKRRASLWDGSRVARCITNRRERGSILEP